MAVAAGMLSCVASVQAAVVAELRAQVTIDGRQVLLQDVASLSGDPVEIARFAGVVLCRAPRVGYVQRLDRKMIDATLRRHGRHGEIRWAGARAVQVASLAQTVSGDLIAQAALGALREMSGVTLSPRLAREVPAVDVPARPWRLQTRRVDVAALTPRSTLWVDVVVDEHVYRSVQVAVDIEQVEPVLVARENMSDGDLVPRTAFEVVRRNVIGLKSAPVGVAQLRDRDRLARPLRAGEALTSDKILKTGAAVSGDRVRVRAIAGGAGVEVDGVLLHGGVHGQRVEVRLAHSAQPVAGTLIDGTTVVVD